MANMRAKIIVEGEIQGVGYREAVKRKAFERCILGQVRNLKDGTVEIIAEGEEENIKDLINQIRIQEYPIFVTGISTTSEEFTGEFKTFTVVRDSDLQKEMFEAISGGTVEIKSLSEKTDKTLEKLGEMTQELHEFRTETQNNFADLGDKYHTVSKELLSINENIAKLHAALTKSTKTIEKSNENIAKLVEYIGLLVARYVRKGRKRF